jgi:hypothetical protein
MAAVIDLPHTSFSAKRQKQPPVGRPNDAGRSREYLTPDEVERMIAAARCAGITLTVRAGMLTSRDSSPAPHPLTHCAEGS